MKIRDYYRNFFGNIRDGFTDFIDREALIITLYVIVMIAFFIIVGPVANIVWGFPAAVCGPLAILGTPVLAFLVWPAVDWWMDQ